MSKYENNAYFWQKIDSLYLSSEFVEIKKKGDSHVDYSDLKYPLPYGILKIDDKDEDFINAFKGSGPNRIDSLVLSIDILNKRVEIRMLIGLDKNEEEEVLRFLDQTDFQKSVLIRRGNEIPFWNDEINV